MNIARVLAGVVATVLLAAGPLQARAADLKEIQARGEIHHLGIRYANFVTGDGDKSRPAARSTILASATPILSPAMATASTSSW